MEEAEERKDRTGEIVKLERREVFRCPCTQRIEPVALGDRHLQNARKDEREAGKRNAPVNNSVAK